MCGGLGVFPTIFGMFNALGRMTVLENGQDIDIPQLLIPHDYGNSKSSALKASVQSHFAIFAERKRFPIKQHSEATS